MDLNSKRLDVVCSISPPGEVREVELNLVPSFVEAHRHRADEWLHTCGRLVVGRAEATAHVLVIEHLDLESEVLFKLLSVWGVCGEMS